MNPQKPKAIDDAVLTQILGGADTAPGTRQPAGPSVVIPQGPFSSFYHS
jgi:hypothetical protein